MNIAIFTDTFLPEINGVATSCNSVFRLLNKYGHNAYVVTTTNEKNVIFKDNVIRIPGLDLKHLYGYRAAFVFNHEAYRIIKSLNLDVIHVNTEFGIGQFGFICSKKLNIPTVYTYHTMYEDYSYYITKGYFDRFSKWTLREFCRSCMDQATEIISPSKKTETYIRSIGVEKRVNIVPTGFDFTRFNVKKSDPKVQEIIKKYDIKHDDKVLLCLGRLAKEKSFDVIIDGFYNYSLKYDTTHIKLLFVGDGPARKELEEQVENYKLSNIVTFVGKVDLMEVPYYYSASDIFLNASISETQGLTFMEAMAGHTVILCRYDNNLVNVINDKISGFFFNDIYDFNVKLEEILNMSEKDLDVIRKNAYESIDLFSEKNFYRNILEVYKRALRRSW